MFYFAVAQLPALNQVLIFDEFNCDMDRLVVPKGSAGETLVSGFTLIVVEAVLHKSTSFSLAFMWSSVPG